MISTIGAFMMAVGHARLRRQRRADVAQRPRAPVNDPWLADTLEWYTTSPPPPWNFDRVPYVISARPLRDLRRRLAEETGPAVTTGPWARLLALAAVAGDRASPSSRAPPAGTRRTGCSPALALPPLAALLVARLGRRARRLLPAALAALVLFGARGAPDRRDAPPRRSPRSRSPRPRCSRRQAFRGEPGPTGERARLRDADEAAGHVAAAADGRRGVFVGAGGVPGLGRFAATMVGLALACGGAAALNHYLDRDIDKLMGSRTARPAGRLGPGRARARARVRDRALGVLVRAARLARQPADRAARARRQPLLRARLHALAQALDAAEHRHRRRRRRRAAARRLRGAPPATSAGRRS